MEKNRGLGWKAAAWVVQERNREFFWRILELDKNWLTKEGDRRLIFAAQNQALRTNAVKARTENRNVSSKCRMSGSHDETVQHILYSCPKLVQTEWRVIHWEVCKEYGVECSDKLMV